MVAAFDGEVLEAPLPVSGLALLPASDVLFDCTPRDADVLAQPDYAPVDEIQLRNITKRHMGKRFDRVFSLAAVAVKPVAVVLRIPAVEFAKQV
jgi:hypothetical protein